MGRRTAGRFPLPDRDGCDTSTSEAAIAADVSFDWIDQSPRVIAGGFLCLHSGS